jgi:GH15 family glucan-1,4-alpha-glucosidase
MSTAVTRARAASVALLDRGAGSFRLGRFGMSANELMERLLRIASPLGLYAEELDVDGERHLGNFPQAFSA